MVPSGPSTPIGGAQSVPHSLLMSNSSVLGGQGGSQGGFPSLVSPRTQYNNVNLLGNVPAFGNGCHNLSNGGAESDPLSGIGHGMEFNPSLSFSAANMVNPGSSGQGQGQQFPSSSGNQMLSDQPHSQQLKSQSFQRLQQQQQQFQSVWGGLAGVGPVKMEPQMSGDQQGPSQSLAGLGQVKIEPQQQLRNMTNLGPVKMESQNSDQSVFLHQQQQHQLLQQMSMSRQSPQAAAAAQINILHHQRLMQIQQQQQQQRMKTIPQQRAQLQQQFSPDNLPLRSPMKPYEPGMCARRLTHYMYQQQHRPKDNNIEFWRKFVAEYFAPNARKKWCVSMYGSGKQTTSIFPWDVWHCEICKSKPGRGFEATVEVLPRLFKIKYESGTLEELLYVDMPREYQNSAGQIVLDYAKAIQESVFEQLRVVRDGQLRIVFSPDLKICSWEFCARRHEELVPRRLLIPQVGQLGTAAQKYQVATQNSSPNVSVSDLQSNCNMFVASARQLAKALEVPLVNDLGYTKRYVRCLQISEVVNSMKDLIDYSRLTGTGPMESLAKFASRTGTPPGSQGQSQQPEEQQQQQQQSQAMIQKSNNDQSSRLMEISSSNVLTNVNNTVNVSSVSTSHSTVAGFLHQNSFNSRQLNHPMNNANSPYAASSVQMPSPSSSNTMQQTPQNPSPFQSPIPSSSNNPPQTSRGFISATPPNHANSANSPVMSNGDRDMNDTQSSVQKIINEMMMTCQLNDGGVMGGIGSLANDMKNVSGLFPTSSNSTLNGPNCHIGNGPASSNQSVGGGPFSGMGVGMSQTSMVNGIRTAMGNNTLGMNGRVGIPSMVRDQGTNHQQPDLANQMLSGFGAVNGFNNLQFG